MPKKKLSVSLAHLATPTSPPAVAPDGRAIQLPTYLNRLMPWYGSPAYLQAVQWRTLVRHQPLAMVCRDTLIAGIKALDWDIVADDPLMAGDTGIKHAIDYYKELFSGLDGDFDTHTDLITQDFYDLPFGGCAEVIREDDREDGPVLAMDHIDAGTLWPTLDDEYPVMQMVPEAAAKAVAFPAHAVNRILHSPRTELRRKGWGMAPPEKVYLALEMMYRGDTYYWKMLLDTPEAGILDLADMSKESAEQWLDGFRSLFMGIDGMKIPVLYEHTPGAVQWIPLNRPPLELLYDKTMLHYTQIMAAGYGLRISDIGLEEGLAGGTLAGVIRSERQTRRSGHATIREALRNYFQRVLPKGIKFVWVERDDEAIVARGRALLTVGQAFQTLIGVGAVDRREARQELVALGLFETDIDPDVLPKQEGSLDIGLLGALLAGKIGPGGLRAPSLTGEALETPLLTSGAEAGPAAAKAPQLGEKMPPSGGGRGELSAPLGMRSSFGDRIRGLFSRKAAGVAPGKNPATRDAKELLAQLDAILKPGLEGIASAAREHGDSRLRRLIRTAAEVIVPQSVEVFRTLDDETIADYWLTERNSLTLGIESELDSAVLRQEEEEIADALDEALAGEDWWEAASLFDKQRILELYTEAYEVGMEDMAVDVIRQMYERGLRSSPALGISFALKNQQVMDYLESRAGDLVVGIDSRTKDFIKRIITAGVRQGISSPEIAQAIRDGATAEEVLANEGFTDAALQAVMEGLTSMSDARANSIANYEIAWAENAGRHDQLARDGFTQKAWIHLGERGVTPAGNIHPCEICEANEAMGFVPMDTLYETVFEMAPFPPAHPGVCHCTIVFNPDELEGLAEGGEFAPWVGE